MEFVSASNVCSITKSTHQGQMSSKTLTANLIKAASQCSIKEKSKSAIDDNSKKIDQSCNFQYGGTPLMIQQEIARLDELALKSDQNKSFSKSGADHSGNSKKSVSLFSNNDSKELKDKHRNLDSILNNLKKTDKLGQYCISKSEKKKIEDFRKMTSLILLELHNNPNISKSSSFEGLCIDFRKAKVPYRMSPAILASVLNKEKKILLINIEHTILYMSQGQILSSNKLIKIRQTTYSLFYRPEIFCVLKELTQNYYIFAFSDQDKDFTERIVNSMDPKSQIFSGYLYRDNLNEIINPAYKCFASNFFFDVPQNLIQHTIIVSYSAYAFGETIDNGVPMSPFYGDKNDGESDSLHQYLNFLVDKPDVTIVNRKCLELKKNLDNEPDEDSSGFISKDPISLEEKGNFNSFEKDESNQFMNTHHCNLVEPIDSDEEPPIIGTFKSRKEQQGEITLTPTLTTRVLNNFSSFSSLPHSPQQCMVVQNSNNNYIINYKIQIINNKRSSKKTATFTRQEKCNVTLKKKQKQHKRNFSCPKCKKKLASSKLASEISPKTPKLHFSTTDLLFDKTHNSNLIQLFSLSSDSNAGSERSR